MGLVANFIRFPAV